MRYLSRIDNGDVAAIWDEIAEIRYEEILSGRDTSYNHVLMPLFNHEVKSLRPRRLLDAGCGLGFITNNVSNFSESVLGVDLSNVSIDLAKKNNSAKNIEYICSSVEDLSFELKFDAIISNMVLMDCADHRSFIRSCYQLLTPGGTLIATLTNPMVWPRYWGYEKCSWFSYHATIHILADFQSSGAGKSGRKSIHTHRPVSEYINSLSGEGFEMVNMAEITGAPVKSKVMSKLPRYLKFTLRKPAS